MKKALFVLIAIILVTVLLLTACDGEFTTESNTTAPETTIAPHDHIFDDATCSAPKTCNICGETEGEPIAHTWIEATCTTPKTCSVCAKKEGDTLEHTWKAATCTTLQTCSVCQKTTGSLASHNYSKGKCKVCKAEDPNDPKNITVWIPTNGGTKYHCHSGCSNMKNPKKTTLEKARNAGFDACARCY